MDKTYKVHLDGYDQTDMLTGAGPSKRHEIWYFAQTKLGALRYDNYKYQFIVQPQGWIGPVTYPNMPILTNLRQDPFERMGWPSGGFSNGSIAYYQCSRPIAGIKNTVKTSKPKNKERFNCDSHVCAISTQPFRSAESLRSLVSGFDSI